MKTTFSKLASLAVVSASLMIAPETKGDLSQAREMAYRIAEKLRGRGFTLFPGENGDNSKTVQTFEFPVTKGVDYAFLVASDIAATISDKASRGFRFNIDLYIEDEFGTQIVADQRDEVDAFVQFTSQYNGTAKAKLVIASDASVGGKTYRRFFFLMGQRGSDPTQP